MKKELVEDTQRFLKDLTGFLIHIGIYVVLNISLVIFMFSDFNRFWWLLFVTVFWSLLVIYHATLMAEKKNTSLRRMFMSIISPSG